MGAGISESSPNRSAGPQFPQLNLSRSTLVASPTFRSMTISAVPAAVFCIPLR